MPKIVDHDQYRKELLRKCFDLFAEKGYGSITMRQIAKALGVSTGTLYHYFPSKKELFWQLIEELNQQDTIDMNARIEVAQTFQEQIEAIFEFHGQNEDYFFKQIAIALDFYQQQDREEILKNETLKKVGEVNRQWAVDLLDTQDPALIGFASCLLLGVLMMRLLEGNVVSYREQASLLGQMLSLYLQQKHETTTE
jgi:AcrR family transcriptional regulator